MIMLIPSGLKIKALNAKDLLHFYGWKRFLGEILPWHFCRSYVFYSQELSSMGGNKPVPPSLSNFYIKQATENDCAAIMAVRPGYYTPEILKKRFQQGHICFLGWKDDRPIHLRWNFIGSIYLPYLKRTLCLGPGEIWADEAYTAAEFRDHKLFAHTGYLLRRILYDHGFTRVSNAFAAWSLSLHRYSEDIGMRRIAEVRYLNLPGYRKYVWEGEIVDRGDQTIVLNL